MLDLSNMFLLAFMFPLYTYKCLDKKQLVVLECEHDSCSRRALAVISS